MGFISDIARINYGYKNIYHLPGGGGVELDQYLGIGLKP